MIWAGVIQTNAQWEQLGRPIAHALIHHRPPPARSENVKQPIVSWEPEGRYCRSKMFRWEPEGRYCHRLCTAIAPFWFSTEHLCIAIMPFWLSTDAIIYFQKDAQNKPMSCKRSQSCTFWCTLLSFYVLNYFPKVLWIFNDSHTLLTY